MHACTGDDDSFKRYGQFRMYSTDENNHVNRKIAQKPCLNNFILNGIVFMVNNIYLKIYKYLRVAILHAMKILTSVLLI